MSELNLKKNKVLNGMLVLDGKAQLAMDCTEYLDAVIHPSIVKNLNVLEGIKPEIFARVLQLVNVKGKESGNSGYFNGQARNLIFYASVFHEGLIDQGKMKKNLSSRLKLIAMMCEKPGANGHPIIDLIKSHPDFPIEGTLINDAVKKFMGLQELGDETKMSVFSTAESWIIPLIQSEALRPWAECETSDIQFDKILEGKKYGFSLPESEFGVAGIAITTLMKSRLYQLMQMRGDKRPNEDNSKRATVFLIIDEVQRIADDSDLAILPVARSLDLVCIFATQNVDSFYEKFGKEGGNVILDSFISFMCFKSSHETMEWVKSRIGKARLWIPSMKTSNIDLAMTAQMDMSNPIFDPQNTHKFWMKRAGFSVLNVLFKRKNVIENNQNTNYLNVAQMIPGEEAQFIVQAKDIQALNEQFMAIASFERGGVPRRDMVRTAPLGNNFKEFDVSHNLSEMTTAEVEKINKLSEKELIANFLD